MRFIDLIVIHCAATPNGRHFSIEAIDSWHYERGFRRDPALVGNNSPHLKSIGYHYVIYTNGAVTIGRGLDEQGAHAAGHNHNSIGICMVGTDKFSVAQWQSLRDNLCLAAKTLSARAELPITKWETPTPREALDLLRLMKVRVCGHRDLPNVKKECPGFDVAAWFAGGMTPPTDHVFVPPATEAR